MASTSRTQRLLAYFGMPVAFCLFGYLMLFIALQPVWDTLVATVGLLVADEAPNFNSDLSVVYDATAQQAQNRDEGIIPGSEVVFPADGEQYGQVVCEQIGLDSPVYWGDSDEILMYGAGQSIISLPPGFGCSVILSGHNTTFFQCLQNAAEGNVIKFHTNYCDYEYTVTRVEVIDENTLNDVLIDASVDGVDEQLIMYTCYPFYVISGRKTDRLVVFADRTSGLDVKWRD